MCHSLIFLLQSWAFCCGIRARLCVVQDLSCNSRPHRVVHYIPSIHLHHCPTIQLDCKSLRQALLFLQSLSVSQVALTKRVQSWWDTGEITEIGECAPPAQPSRIDSLTVVEPGKIKRGKGGTQVHTVPLRGVTGVELISKPRGFYNFPWNKRLFVISK